MDENQLIPIFGFISPPLVLNLYFLSSAHSSYNRKKLDEMEQEHEKSREEEERLHKEVCL